LTVGGKTIKTAKGKESRSIASDASSQGSVERTKRTRGDSQQIAEGKTLEVRFSKKQQKKDAPDSGRGRCQGAAERLGLIVIQAKVSKLNRKEAKTAKLAADKAERENASKSKRSDTERFIDSQADKSGHIVPEDLDQGPPGVGD
jgi:ribosomal 50S subunit-recycling heat shock protein